MPDINGIIVSSVTPFTQSGDRVDAAWAPEHFQHLREGGVHGLSVLGSVSEGASMAMVEMKQIVDLAVEHRGELSIIVGTGNSSPEETLEIGNYGLEKGADAVLLTPPPHFVDADEAARSAYLSGVLEGLPATSQVILLHDPRQAGSDLTDEIITALLDRFDGHILGIKDSGENADHLKHLIETYPDLRIFTGRDAMIVQGFQAGAAGAFSVFANVVPGPIVEIGERFRNGDDLEDRAWLLAQMQQILDEHGTIGAIKALIPLLAEPGMTHPRAPHTVPSLGSIKTLEDRMIEVFGLPGLFHSYN